MYDEQEFSSLLAQPHQTNPSVVVLHTARSRIPLQKQYHSIQLPISVVHHAIAGVNACDFNSRVVVKKMD